MMTKGHVSICGSADFPCTYDPSDRWNGFVAEPRFELETARQVIDFLNTLATDEESDYYTESDVLAPDYLPTFWLVSDGGARMEAIEPDEDGLYSIGARGYTWEEGIG